MTLCDSYCTKTSFSVGKHVQDMHELLRTKLNWWNSVKSDTNTINIPNVIWLFILCCVLFVIFFYSNLPIRWSGVFFSSGCDIHEWKFFPFISNGTFSNPNSFDFAGGHYQSWKKMFFFFKFISFALFCFYGPKIQRYSFDE